MKEFFDHIVNNFPVDSQPVKLFSLVKEFYIGVGREEDDAAEVAQKKLQRYKILLKDRENFALTSSQIIPYAFNSIDDDYIQGLCFCEPMDPPEIVAAKNRRLKELPIFKVIETFSPSEFEDLCAVVLKFFGINDAVVTRRSGDGEVDFYGCAPILRMFNSGNLPSGVEEGLNIWIVGQAKKYKATKVSTNELRELVGSTELARSKVFVGDKDPLDKLLIRFCDPVIYMIITSGSFTADSKDIIRKSGIIAMDGILLSRFLADNGLSEKVDSITKQSILDLIVKEK